jgi:hypothetical protein
MAEDREAGVAVGQAAAGLGAVEGWDSISEISRMVGSPPGSIFSILLP